MDQIVVGVADCRFGHVPGQVLATYALGSCIGLAVHDPATAVGGLLHFMLPDSTIDPARGRQKPFMFADTGIPLLLEQVCGSGASKRRLQAYAIGGAQMVDQESVFEIGKRNYLAMRRILWKAGVLLNGEVVGGSSSRTVRLEIGTGRLWIREAGMQTEMVTSMAEKGRNSWRIVS
ncbi:MAG TPA: chemotaxis protein CheD [Bryobacteraceae bacterium]|nr:chemotaxis protein CheD [Bryobacteraceae bacterium]